MAQIKKIELENFRVFEDKVAIDFYPPTILTGANNAGKSSILKSLLLLADNAIKNKFLELDFSGDKHNLDAFKYAKNNTAKNNCISINFQLVKFGGDVPEFSRDEMFEDKYFSSLDLPFPGKLDVQLKYQQHEETGKLIPNPKII